MNSNPKPHIKVYVCIQLFDTFKELHFIARKLKYNKIIANYRLDKNGHTMISLRINTQSFRFTGLHQLEALGLQIPPNLVEEINQRKTQIFNLRLKVPKCSCRELIRSAQTTDHPLALVLVQLLTSQPITEYHLLTQVLQPQPSLGSHLPNHEQLDQPIKLQVLASPSLKSVQGWTSRL